MATTHGVGRFFFHKIPLRPDAPRIHRWKTHELDEPFRVSNSVIVRLFGERGIVLGWWQESDLDEESALVEALGREMAADPEEIEQWMGTLER